MRNAARHWFVFLPVLALAQAASEKPKIICDHAAPPPGMHYVCKSQCDCHLEGKLRNDEDGIAPVPSPASDANEPKSCRYDAPKTGELLICDSACKCRPYLSPKQKSKKKDRVSATTPPAKRTSPRPPAIPSSQ